MAEWYAEIYAADPEASNPFGSESLAERRNAALLDHIRRGGSPLTFRRAQVIDLQERAVGMAGSVK